MNKLSRSLVIILIKILQRRKSISRNISYDFFKDTKWQSTEIWNSAKDQKVLDSTIIFSPLFLSRSTFRLPARVMEFESFYLLRREHSSICVQEKLGFLSTTIQHRFNPKYLKGRRSCHYH